MRRNFGKLFTIMTCLPVLCFTFSACDPSDYRFTSEDLADVISIELIDYENPEQERFASWIPDHTADLEPFDDSKMSRLENLDANEISDFVDSLCECSILYKYFAYDSPNENCVKLNYSNGDFLILWSDYTKGSYSGYIGIFSPDGEVKEFIGCFQSLDSYKHLVNAYFQTQI